MKSERQGGVEGERKTEVEIRLTVMYLSEDIYRQWLLYMWDKILFVLFSVDPGIK